MSSQREQCGPRRGVAGNRVSDGTVTEAAGPTEHRRKSGEEYAQPQELGETQGLECVGRHSLQPPSSGEAGVAAAGDSPAEELGLEGGPGGAPGAQLGAAQGCGPGVVERRQVFALLPHLVPLWLEDAHEDIHGDLNHVLPACALQGTGQA